MSKMFALDVLDSVLRNLITKERKDKVMVFERRHYRDKAIAKENHKLILYRDSEKYDIVLQRRYECFRLYRTEDLQEAEDRFSHLKDKVPLLVEISQDCCNQAGIQKLCDALQENPKWSVAHLAAYLALHDTFKDGFVRRHINSLDLSSGLSPLQVAIKTGNLRTVQALLSARPSLEHRDHEANSVFHHAANTTKDIIVELRELSTRYLNSPNSLGYTPLHMACQADKLECVKALLEAGADVNISTYPAITYSFPSSSANPGYVGDFQHDMKFGGTPLHCSRSREVIEALVSMGCDIDKSNFDGHTALHIMVLRNHLECVVALLSHEAKTDIGDREGNTPLHLAVTQDSVAIVQALVVFGANLSYKNNVGATPRHSIRSQSCGSEILYVLNAVGAPRCSLGMEGCNEGCSASSDYNGVPPSSESQDLMNQLLSAAGKEVASTRDTTGRGTKRGRLLCLDGGGIRGLVLVVMLQELENELERPVSHCFDWIAGTSTGGILALALAAGKSLKECLGLYFRMKDHAFVGRRPYSSEQLENILKETLGTDTVMADIKQPKVMITAVLTDYEPVQLHIFRNYDSPRRLLGLQEKCTSVPDSQLLWQSARATGAAPSFFRAFGRFVDGGLIANNPTMDALTEIHEYNVALKATGRCSEVRPVTVVVSLGTGHIPVTETEVLDVFFPESWSEICDAVTAACGLVKVVLDQVTATDGHVVDRARAWCNMIHAPYFRLTPQISEDIEIDETSDTKLVNMMWETKAYIHANHTMLKEVAQILK